MDFDFHTSFAGKTNIELLQIVLQKELYQKAAVEAAEAILAGRKVADDEKAMAKDLINQKAVAVEKRREQSEKVRSEVARTVQNLVFPAERNPAFYIRSFAIVFLIYWLINAIPNLRLYGSMLVHSTAWGVIALALELLTLLMIYWLFKLDKRGWALLMAYFAFGSIDAIISLINWVEPKFAFSFMPDRSTYIYKLLICGCVFYFFNRDEAIKTLQISPRFRTKVILYFVLPIVALYLLSTFTDLNWSYYFSDIFISN